MAHEYSLNFDKWKRFSETYNPVRWHLNHFLSQTGGKIRAILTYPVFILIHADDEFQADFCLLSSRG